MIFASPGTTQLRLAVICSYLNPCTLRSQDLALRVSEASLLTLCRTKDQHLERVGSIWEPEILGICISVQRMDGLSRKLAPRRGGRPVYVVDGTRYLVAVPREGLRGVSVSANLSWSSRQSRRENLAPLLCIQLAWGGGDETRREPSVSCIKLRENLKFSER